jgi:two-component system sensor histidine kinase YesM
MKIAEDSADMVASVFQTVRFISGYYPIIRDVVVAGLNEIPFSYYIGSGYDFMDLMRPEYDFTNPDVIESRFFYFNGQDYFVYVTPVSALYSTVGDTRKIASCIFICDLAYIRDLLTVHSVDPTVNFSVYDKAARLIASGEHEDQINKTVEAVSCADTMALTVIARGGPASFGFWRDETARFFIIFLFFSILLLVIITLTVIYLLRKRIALPVSNLVKSMLTQDDKPLHTRLAHSNIDEIDHIVEGVNTMLDEIETYTKKSLAAQEKLYETELLKNKTEIYALQSQINPHFLNNTLQCIRSIAITKQIDEIAAITLAMSELFRYSMNYEEHVLVSEEIDIVKHYIVIINIRFKNRFSFTFDIDNKICGCAMCRMILQPIVENAVHYGVSRREDGGSVGISGRRENDVICFEVTDDGPGFSAARLDEVRAGLARGFAENRSLNKGGSLGLYNISQRLKLYYGEEYGLDIERKDGKTLVRLRFPDIS